MPTSKPPNGQLSPWWGSVVYLAITFAILTFGWWLLRWVDR